MGSFVEEVCDLEAAVEVVGGRTRSFLRSERTQFVRLVCLGEGERETSPAHEVHSPQRGWPICRAIPKS
jgi:hypothetical protein